MNDRTGPVTSTSSDFELRAEAAYEAMYDARPPAVKDWFETARSNFLLAIGAAEACGDAATATRIRQRLAEVSAVYERQFRHVGYS